MTSRRHLVLLVSALVAGAAAGAAAQATGAPISVQAAVGIEPDTVRIGDPFVVQIGIRAPRGATIAFPPAPDSTGAVQSLDPVRVEIRPDSGGVVQWGYYRVAAWDIGDQPITLGDVVVTVGGRSRRIAITGRKVFVASVLPADTAQRVPKPPRRSTSSLCRWWLWLTLAAAAVILLFSGGGGAAASVAARSRCRIRSCAPSASSRASRRSDSSRRASAAAT